MGDIWLVSKISQQKPKDIPVVNIILVSRVQMSSQPFFIFSPIYFKSVDAKTATQIFSLSTVIRKVVFLVLTSINKEEFML